MIDLHYWTTPNGHKVTLFLEETGSRGFSGMLFDFVVSSDERRLKLWSRAGFQTVGTLPKAFRHPTLGLIDVLVLYHAL